MTSGLVRGAAALLGLVLVLLVVGASPTTARAADTIAFVDAQHGWRVTFVGDAAMGGSAILWSTADGGSTWKRLATQEPGYTSGAGYVPGLLSFADRKTGLWGRFRALRLLRTTDGGRKWTDVGPGRSEMLWDFAFSSPKVAWACTGVGSADDGGAICRSTDGGSTWSVLYSDETVSGGYPAGAFYSLSSPTDRACYVGGTGTRLGGLWVTLDGGEHWLRRHLPGGTRIDFPATGIGWNIGTDSIFKSMNSGRTWSRERLPVDVSLWAIDFVDTLHGWVVGESGTIVRTVNGGATWQKLDSGTKAVLTEVQFVDAKHGWVTGVAGGWTNPRQVLLRTTDGGKSWTRLQ